MQKQVRISRAIVAVMLVTALLLMLPLVAMRFTTEVNWSPADFLIMGALISGTGLAYVLLTRSAPNVAYRAAMGLALLSTFLMIWANLAVGLIGSGANAGNLTYMAVVFVVVIGTIRSGFKAAGMERAMYVTALSLALLTAIAFIAGMHYYPGSSALELLAVGGFFAGLYLVAGSLFRYAGRVAGPRQAR